MHDLTPPTRLGTPLFLCLSLTACRAAVGDGDQEGATSEPAISTADTTSTSESDETTPSEVSTGPGSSELSGSTTAPLQPAEYSAVGADGPGFDYRWIQVQKYDPALEYCVTVSLIQEPSQSQPGFENVEMWGIWRVEGGWSRAPVVDCRDRDVEPTPVNAVSGRVAPEPGENSPCTLPLVELSIDLPESDAWPSADLLFAEDLAVEEAFSCD